MHCARCVPWTLALSANWLSANCLWSSNKSTHSLDYPGNRLLAYTSVPPSICPYLDGSVCQKILNTALWSDVSSFLRSNFRVQDSPQLRELNKDPLSKAIIWPIYHDYWETMQDDINFCYSVTGSRTWAVDRHWSRWLCMPHWPPVNAISHSFWNKLCQIHLIHWTLTVDDRNVAERVILAVNGFGRTMHILCTVAELLFNILFRARCNVVLYL